MAETLNLRQFIEEALANRDSACQQALELPNPLDRAYAEGLVDGMTDALRRVLARLEHVGPGQGGEDGA